MTGYITRFAPSPTGRLHVGHAYSALFAERAAAGGRFLLRIEDLDPVRCRPEFEAGIFEDLAWLGLTWERPVRRQSEHLAVYAALLDQLEAQGLVYPCFCTRAEIRAEALRIGHAPHAEDGEGPVYPGTCRHLSPGERAERRESGQPFALRLDVAAALRRTGPLVWHDARAGWVPARPEMFGDVVLGRKDVPASYHLACTHDDALQGVDRVTRGQDLFAATHIHRLLQAVFGWPVPAYHHHRLLTDGQGRRLAKRDRALTLASLRAAGVDPLALRARLERGEGDLSSFIA